MTPDEALAAAWTYCAPSRLKDALYPRGFWPDVGRVALYMLDQNTVTPQLDFEPTRCTHGNQPASLRRAKKSKAENTAALLAMLSASQNAK